MMKQASGLRTVAVAFSVVVGLAVSASVRADTVDLQSFLVMSEQESGEIRQLIAVVFRQLGLNAQECAGGVNTISVCARPARADAMALTERWDSTFGRLAEGWSGASLPWRTIGTAAAVLGYRKALAQDRGTSVFLMRVFIPHGPGRVLEIRASKHPWL